MTNGEVSLEAHTSLRGPFRFLKNLALFCVGLFASDISVPAAGFEASGTTKMESFGVPNAPTKPFVGKFKIRSDGRSWEIGFQWNKATVTERVLFDGTNTYAITGDIGAGSSLGDASLQSFSNELPDNSKTVVATIFSGELPWGASPHIRFLWLTFISGQLDQPERLADFPAPWTAAYLPEARGFHGLAKWTDDHPKFPSSVVFMAAASNWSNAVQAIQSPSAAISPAPFGNDFIGGEFRVLEWRAATNKNNLSRYPWKVICERYYYPSVAGGKTNQVAERLSAEVLEFAAVESAVVRPDPKSNIHVSDYRFRNSDMPWIYVQYEIADGLWKETNDSLVATKLDYTISNYVAGRSDKIYGKSSHSSQLGKAKTHTFPRNATILALAVSTISFLVILLRSHSKKQRTNSTIRS